MLKNPFVKAGFFTASILAPLYFLSKTVDARAKEMYIDKPSYVISVKGKQYDYVVGGSSRVHNNFNTPLFDSLLGSSGYNIGYGGSGMAQVYLTLYLFLENGNRMGCYIQQVDDIFLTDPNKAFSYPFQDYFFMPYLGQPEVDGCFRNSITPLKYYIWRYVPFMKYAEYNNYYSFEHVFGRPKVDEEMLRQKGYSRLAEKSKAGFPLADYKRQADRAEVDRINIFYLDKIRELCASHKIRFVLYSSPSYYRSYNSYPYSNLHDTLVSYVHRYGVPYFNFLTDPQYRGDTMFYDETHLNAAGTDVFTAQLADSLKKLIK